MLNSENAIYALMDVRHEGSNLQRASTFRATRIDLRLKDADDLPQELIEKSPARVSNTDSQVCHVVFLVKIGR